MTVSFTSGPPENLEDNLCAAEYEFDVVETPELVTVTVHQLKLADPPDVNYGCDGHGYARAERESSWMVLVSPIERSLTATADAR